jgi:arylsulfatase A-like enzyme
MNTASKATVVLSLTLALSSATYAAAAEQANVVFLFADDLGYGNVSSYGGDVPTPHIDSIGRNGVRFTSGYMTAPVCNPSRHGMITGRYQQRWGKELNSQTVPPVGQEQRRDLPLDQKTIADALGAAGYRTGAFGKWQLSWRNGYHPLERGFDYFVGMVSGMSHLDPSWPSAHVAPRAELLEHAPENPEVLAYIAAEERAARENPSPKTGPPKGLFRGREPIELEEYLTDQLAREAVEFIERNKDRPFFLYLPFYAVHSPVQVTDEYYQRVGEYRTETRRIFSGMITSVDDAVGSVLAKLREAGLEEKTLVIFASDNGAQETFDVEGVNNRPLIGHKRNLYEGGIRIPFAMQWKGRIPPGQTYTHPIHSLDIFPTSLAAAGVEDVAQYTLDGINLLPYLEGQNQGPPHEYLFWRSGHNSAIRHGEWKLLISGSEITRLYNVEKDPGESTDLSSRHPELVRKMKQALERWSEQMVAPRESSRRVKTHYNGDEIEWDI